MPPELVAVALPLLAVQLQPLKQYVVEVTHPTCHLIPPQQVPALYLINGRPVLTAVHFQQM